MPALPQVLPALAVPPLIQALPPGCKRDTQAAPMSGSMDVYHPPPANIKDSLYRIGSWTVFEILGFELRQA